MTVAILLAAAVASCGDGAATPGRELARIGPDTRSAPFQAPGPWHVSVAADGYCAVVVFAEPSGANFDAKWDLNSFEIHVEEPGQYSIETNGCITARAMADDS